LKACLALISRVEDKTTGVPQTFFLNLFLDLTVSYFMSQLL
jgi:hypothetical protein